MATCSSCGCEFNVSDARRMIGRRYGAGSYNDEYPDGDVCGDCALEYLGAAWATGEEVLNLARMCGWDDDDD